MFSFGSRPNHITKPLRLVRMQSKTRRHGESSICAAPLARRSMTLRGRQMESTSSSAAWTTLLVFITHRLVSGTAHVAVLRLIQLCRSIDTPNRRTQPLRSRSRMGSTERVRRYTVVGPLCAHLQLEDQGWKLHFRARTVDHCEASEDGSSEPQDFFARSTRVRTSSTTLDRVCVHECRFTAAIGAEHTNHTCPANESAKHYQP